MALGLGKSLLPHVDRDDRWRALAADGGPIEEMIIQLISFGGTAAQTKLWPMAETDTFMYTEEIQKKQTNLNVFTISVSWYFHFRKKSKIGDFKKNI